MEVKRDTPQSDLYLSGLTETIADGLGERARLEEAHPQARLLSSPGRGS